jgi:tetratricopeptide (TPR) repeat protein
MPHGFHYHDQAELLLANPIGTVMGAAAWAELGFCALAVNKLERARSMFHQGLTIPTSMMHLSRPQLLVGNAFVSLAEGDVDAALKCVEEAQAYIVDHKMVQIAPYVSLAMGKVHYAKGDYNKAIEDFSRAELTALEMDLRPVVWQAQANAAKALEISNQNGLAQGKRNRALDVIDEIKNLFEDQELRNIFATNAMGELNVGIPTQ